MSYSAEISRTSPTAFLFLVDQSSKRPLHSRLDIKVLT